MQVSRASEPWCEVGGAGEAPGGDQGEGQERSELASWHAGELSATWQLGRAGELDRGGRIGTAHAGAAGSLQPRGQLTW